MDMLFAFWLSFLLGFFVVMLAFAVLGVVGGLIVAGLILIVAGTLLVVDA